MDPAYQIPLTDEALVMLGEVTVILGQVDEEMVRTVSGLISTDRETANAVMGSTNMENNTGIWAKLIAQRTDDLETLWLVDLAMKEFPVVARLRNDLIHADYIVTVDTDFGSLTMRNLGVTARREDGRRIVLGLEGPVNARRVRNGKMTPAEEITGLRDRAGRLSCLVAHIGYLLAHQSSHTPWRDRLLPTLPPRPDDWEPGKAKVPQAQRPPSRPSRQSPPPRPAGE